MVLSLLSPGCNQGTGILKTCSVSQVPESDSNPGLPPSKVTCRVILGYTESQTRLPVPKKYGIEEAGYFKKKGLVNKTLLVFLLPEVFSQDDTDQVGTKIPRLQTTVVSL